MGLVVDVCLNVRIDLRQPRFGSRVIVREEDEGAVAYMIFETPDARISFATPKRDHIEAIEALLAEVGAHLGCKEGS